jgi:hypothetical protein
VTPCSLELCDKKRRELMMKEAGINGSAENLTSKDNSRSGENHNSGLPKSNATGHARMYIVGSRLTMLVQPQNPPFGGVIANGQAAESRPDWPCKFVGVAHDALLSVPVTNGRGGGCPGEPGVSAYG